MCAYSPIKELKLNMQKTIYPIDKKGYIADKVEAIPTGNEPSKITLLGIDTNCYESTRCELAMLYPLIVNSEELIEDDYDHFIGAKKAADKYLKAINQTPLSNRIDYTGRFIIKK